MGMSNSRVVSIVFVIALALPLAIAPLSCSRPEEPEQVEQDLPAAPPAEAPDEPVADEPEDILGDPDDAVEEPEAVPDEDAKDAPPAEPRVVLQPDRPELPVTLTVDEPAGVEQRSAPVTGGVPMPWGVFEADQRFVVLEGDAPVPAQVLPLIVDKQGYIRWVLVDFQTDLGPNEQKTFTLDTAEPVEDQPAGLARETENGVEVDTGAMRFTIDRDKPFTLFTTLSVGDATVIEGGEVSYIDSTKDELRRVARQPSSVVIDHNGPMRATVIIRAPFDDDDETKTNLTAIARITAWRGRTDVHVKYSLANSNPEHYTYRRIKESSIALGLTDGTAGTLVGATEPQTLDGAGSVTRGLRSTAGRREPVEGHSKIEQGDATRWQADGPGQTANGWLAVRTGDRTVFVADRYFNDDPPRRLATTDDQLVLSGVVPRYDGPGAPFPMHDTNRWLMDCSHLDSQYIIDFAASDDIETLDAKAEAAREYWIIAFAPPAWYFETEGLSVGRFGTQADEIRANEVWELEFDPNRAPTASFDRRRYVWGEDNHYETECDIVESMLLMYLRTGGRAFFRSTEAWANNSMALQQWRTDGWQWRDGGVWWTRGGPCGNRPTRAADPVTGRHNNLPNPWADDPGHKDLSYLANAKQCYCHNYGAGLAGWFSLTGDRDAKEAAIDSVEQNYDTQVRVRGKRPGNQTAFARDFTRSFRLTNAARLIAPQNEFVREASDMLAQIFLQREVKEPRGLPKIATGPLNILEFKYEDYVGEQGMQALKEEGVLIDQQNGMLTDFRTGARWAVVISPNSWQYPPLSRAMEAYYRLTGDEDALDYLIAYGQATAYLLYQPAHHCLHPRFMLDFPVKGVTKDYASWTADKPLAEGIQMSGYLARFHPDLSARAYQYTGEDHLRDKAKWIWMGGSHRRYQATEHTDMSRIGRWSNIYGPHADEVGFIGKTFYLWSHEREDKEPPEPITDLTVKLDGQTAVIRFTEPHDRGGGEVARYQVKYSDKPLVSYQDFLEAWANNTDSEVTNWWMGVNLDGEPKPGNTGEPITFTVTGIQEFGSEPRYFAVRSFDNFNNRSMLSNVAQPE